MYRRQRREIGTRPSGAVAAVGERLRRSAEEAHPTRGEADESGGALVTDEQLEAVSEKLSQRLQPPGYEYDPLDWAALSLLQRWERARGRLEEHSCGVGCLDPNGPNGRTCKSEAELRAIAEEAG